MNTLARLIQDWRADAAFNPRETNPGYAHALEKWADELDALIAASPCLLDQKKEHDDEELGARSSPSTQTGAGDIASARPVDPPSARNEER